MYSAVTLLLVALMHLNGRTTAGSLGPGFSGPIIISPASNFGSSGTGGNFFFSGNTGSSGTDSNFGSRFGQSVESSNIRVGPATPAGVDMEGSNLIGGSSGQDRLSQGSTFIQGQAATSGQGPADSASLFVNQGQTIISSGQSSVSGAGIKIINLGQSGQGASGSGQLSGSSLGFNQNQGSSGQSSGTVIGVTDGVVTGSGFVNRGQGSFISSSGQGSGSGSFVSSSSQGSVSGSSQGRVSGIRFVNQGSGSQSFGSSNQANFVQFFAPETLTVTDTTTIDSFVTVTETILNSVPVTITGFSYDTVTITTRGLHQTQVDDVMSLTTTVVERPVTEFVTTAKSNFVYVTEVSVDIYTITHRAHLISQTTFTTVVVQTLTLSSPIVRTSLSTSVAVSTEYRTIVNTVFSHGYN